MPRFCFQNFWKMELNTAQIPSPADKLHLHVQAPTDDNDTLLPRKPDLCYCCDAKAIHRFRN